MPCVRIPAAEHPSILVTNQSQFQLSMDASLRRASLKAPPLLPSRVALIRPRMGTQQASPSTCSARLDRVLDRHRRPVATHTTMDASAATGGASSSEASPIGSQPAKHSRVAIFVEPSPFSHVSGMKNRFECLIKGLREAGDQVVVYTPDPKPPAEFCGAKVSPSHATGACSRAGGETCTGGDS